MGTTENTTKAGFEPAAAQAQMRKGVLELCIPLLTRLKNAGMLGYRWEESTSGPPRKYYKLTEAGELYLKELQQSWSELVEAVDKTIAQNKNIQH